jgi:hypothetical protein
MVEKFVTRSHRIDPFTVVRKRVILSGDRCRICGFSICERNKLPPFNTLDNATQQKIKQALARHRDVAHPTQHKPVVGRDELPKQWLGGQPDLNSVTTPLAASEGWFVQPREVTEE